eukprot:tig00000057_g131.t1
MRFLYYVIATLCFSAMMYSFNELFSLLLPTAELAHQAAVAAIGPMALFAGPPLGGSARGHLRPLDPGGPARARPPARSPGDRLHPIFGRAAPSALPVHYLSFLKYPLESLSVNELAGLPITCTPNESPACIQQYGSISITGDALSSSYGFSFDWRWRDVGIMLGFFAFLKVMSAIVVTKVRHARK